MSKKATEFLLGPKTRACYVHLMDKTSVNGGNPHYSCCFLIRKDDAKTVESVKKALRAAYDEGQDTLKGTGKTVPTFEALKSPLRDGDVEHPDREEYKGCYFINANNYNRKPTVVDTEMNPIEDPNEIYSGMFCKAFCSAYVFNRGVNKGIAVSLEHVMTVSDGERLGGSPTSVTDAFSDDEDFLS